MALTGLPIKGADAYRAGLVEGVLDSPVHFHEDIVDAVRATEEGTFDPQH
jgi:enoyl-CoA hydratase/carnithine racemase